MQPEGHFVEEVEFVMLVDVLEGECGLGWSLAWKEELALLWEVVAFAMATFTPHLRTSHGILAF
jgi:hypothetical protein